MNNQPEIPFLSKVLNAKVFLYGKKIGELLTLFQSNTPLACCGDGKLPRKPLITI